MLYVAQGLPYGFVTITLAAHLREQGIATADLASLLAMTTLPWSFKWCWGPLIDGFQIRSLGRRRPWILFAQMMMAVSMCAILLVPNLIDNVKLLIAIVFMHNVFGSMQDVSVDALAIDLLPASERGRANGFMYGSSYLGTMLGGAGLGIVASRWGLHTAVLVQLQCFGVIFLLPLLLRERRGDRLFIPTWAKSDGDEQKESFSQLLREILAAFRHPVTWWCALLALAVKVGSGVSLTIGVVAFVGDDGWTSERYSIVMGGLAVGFGLAGALLGGILSDWTSPTRVAVGAAGALAFIWIGFGLIESQWMAPIRIVSFLCVQEFFAALLSVALFALFMSVAVPRVAATQFTAYMAFLNLSTTIGVMLAGKFPDWLSTGHVFVIIGLWQVVPIFIIFVVHRVMPDVMNKEKGLNG
jgi:PAT family beta-lactamase induction signal transducer AmpG